MTPDDPRHGLRAGYLAGCRQDCCTAANTRTVKKYKLDALRNGGRTTIDPAPVRTHLRRLQTRMSLNAIAHLSGSSASHLQNILDEAHPVMLRDLATRILAVTLDTPMGTHWVDATGSRRRLQALAVLGFSFERIAAMIDGCRAFNLREIAYGNRSRLQAENEQQIKALYDRITRAGESYKPRNHHERQGAERIKSRARRSGWVSALAWEDETIDDPKARPVGIPTKADIPAIIDESRIQRRIDGDRKVRLHRGEAPEVVRRMLADGHTASQINKLTGIKVERYYKVSEQVAA